MGEIKVSVILPSLNVCRYIEECLESVVNQTLKDIEIICVDAGSDDGTLEIINDYAAKDDRIKVLISDRKSYGYQMNIGVDNASGEYIGIVETDDYVLPEMYEELYKIASENDLDLIRSDFYRFTGSGETLSKAYNRQTGDVSAYNHIYDIKHNQIAFRFLMNTWCGIYKKEFLDKNHIRHNETPGASYQDNGFWFQTLMFSEKAWFLDRAFYMNRRDNVDSSVFSTGKVYCICDEYDHIYSILKKNSDLMEDYGFSFVTACFFAYKGNLDRIADEYKEEFLVRFSEDLRKYRDAGLVDFDRFEETDRQTMVDIIDDPHLYYYNNLERIKLFYDELKKHRNIIIYGAGLIGKRVLHDLTYCNDPAKVMCFAVSRVEENYDSIKGIPIIDIHDLLEYRESGYVVIATTHLYQDEIMDNLKKLGFVNVFAYPDQLRKDEKYFRQLDFKERQEELNRWVYGITGKTVDFDDPKSFNDIQHAKKIGDIPDLQKKVSDLVFMGQWAGKIIGDKYMPPVTGIYDSVEDIPWDELPDRFIIKLSHGRSFRSTVKNKQDSRYFNRDVLQRRLNAFFKSDYSFGPSMERWYEGIVPKVVIERPVEGSFYHDSYKFICCKGHVRYVVSDRNNDIWDTIKRDFYDVFWNHLDIRMKYPNSRVKERKPDHLEEMILFSEKLSSSFEFSIVHFWDTKDGPVFNKIRFIIGAGVEKIVPEFI